MDTRLNFSRLNLFLIGSFILGLIVAVLYDLINYSTINGSLEHIHIWIIDEDFHLPFSPKATAMCSSVVLGIMAAIVFFIITSKLHEIQKAKTDKYLSSLVYYSALYTGFARVIESFYVLSESDLKGIVYSAGYFYIPLDIMAMTLYFTFTFEVFLISDDLHNKQLGNIIRFVFYSGLFLGIAFLVNYYLPSTSIIKNLVEILSYILLFIVFVLQLIVSKRILYLRKRVDENKRALLFIGIQLIDFGVLLVLLVFAQVFGGDLAPMAYWFRTIKNGLFIVHALLYYPAFLQPFRAIKS